MKAHTPPAEADLSAATQENEQLKDTYADFKVRVTSQPARALIADLTDRISAWETKQKQQNAGGTRGPYGRGAKGIENLRNAVGRFVGLLLIAKADPRRTGKVFRSLKTDGFTGGPVTHTAFQAAWKGLAGLKLLSHIPGKPRYHPLGFHNAPMQVYGQASLFEATGELLAIAEQHGVSLDNVTVHFIQPRPPLQLRTFGTWEWTSKSKARKISGEALAFTPNKRTEALAEQVRRLNDFLATFTMQGGCFVGFHRIFNTDVGPDAFSWNKGGRLYAYGNDTYQQLSGQQRALITINDEPTVEVDISASYLTLFHGLTRQRLDTDDGDLWGRVQLDDKQVAKDWINLSLTTGARLRKWPEEKIEAFRERTSGDLENDYPVQNVEAKALSAFPALKMLDTSSFTWAELMFEEAEVVISTMTKLMDRGVPAFPVFDSIIIQQSKARLATGVLYDEFYQRIGKKPLLKTKSTLPGASEAIHAAIHVDERWVSALDL